MNTDNFKRLFNKKDSKDTKDTKDTNENDDLAMNQDYSISESHEDDNVATQVEPERIPQNDGDKRFIAMAELYILPALVLGLVFIALILVLVMPDKKIAVTLMVTAIPFIVIVGMLQLSNTLIYAEGRGMEAWSGQTLTMSILFIVAAGLQLIVALIVALSDQKGSIVSASILQLLVVGSVTAMYPLSLVEPKQESS